MIACGQIAGADAHPVAFSDDERVNSREGPAVPGPQIEVEHGVDLGRVAARLNVIGVEQEYEIPVDRHEVGIFSDG